MLRLAVASPKSPRRSTVVRGVCAIALTLLLIETLRVTAFSNFHSVLGDRVFRSAQLSEQQVIDRAEKHGIRTIINLRGTCTDFEWYKSECRGTHACNISQEDITLSSGRLPPPQEIHRLVEVLDNTEYPILLHCRRGADRTGLAATLVHLLYSDATVSEARRQHGIRYGHMPVSITANIDRFFDLYEEWLDRLNIDHSRDVFRQWVMKEYCPGACRGRLVLLDPPTLKYATGSGLRVRAHNDSIETWHLKPGQRTGVHVRFMITHESGNYAHIGYAGFFRADVKPNDSIELLLPIPPLPVPGKYFFTADLFDEDEMAFAQLGGKPLMQNLEVSE